MGTFVFEYGLLPPSESDFARVEEQIVGAHRYYNLLIEIERSKREKIQAILARDKSVEEYKSKISAIDEAIEQRITAIKKSRSEARKNVFKQKDATTVKDLRKTRKELSESLKLAKKRVKEDPEIQDAIEACQEETAEQIRQARKASGVFWGTYLFVESAVDAARRSIAPPRFKNWSGGGLLGVQIQQGIPAEKIFGNDTRLQIDPVPETAWLKQTRRGERKVLSRTKVRFRVGSDGRKPIFVEFPMVMHRPLPRNSSVRWGKIVVRNVCDTLHYVLQLTIQDPRVPTRKSDKPIGIDVGWRQLESGELRVAYWKDEDGEGELRLPKSIIERFEKASEERGKRDKLLEEIRNELVQILSQPVEGPLLPETERETARDLLHEDLKKKIEFLEKWKSQHRLHALHKMIKMRRAASDVTDVVLGDPTWDRSVEAHEKFFDRLDWWHERDNHMGLYEHGTRRSAILHRREVYRIFARKLADKYGQAVLEKWDLTKLIRRDPLQPKDARAPNHQRVMAAPSVLRTCLTNTLRREGAFVTLKDSALQSSSTCDCGHVNKWTGKTIEVTCEKCDKTWDRDALAAKNLFDAALSIKELEGEIEKAEIKKPKWNKRHKKASPEENPGADADVKETSSEG